MYYLYLICLEAWPREQTILVLFFSLLFKRLCSYLRHRHSKPSDHRPQLPFTAVHFLIWKVDIGICTQNTSRRTSVCACSVLEGIQHNKRVKIKTL